MKWLNYSSHCTFRYSSVGAKSNQNWKPRVSQKKHQAWSSPKCSTSAGCPHALKPFFNPFPKQAQLELACIALMWCAGDYFPSSECNCTDKLFETLYVSLSGPRSLFKEHRGWWLCAGWLWVGLWLPLCNLSRFPLIHTHIHRDSTIIGLEFTLKSEQYLADTRLPGFSRCNAFQGMDRQLLFKLPSFGSINKKKKSALIMFGSTSKTVSAFSNLSEPTADRQS